MLLLTTAILLAGLSICNGGTVVTMSQAIRDAVINPHNNERARLTIPKLAWNATLEKIATAYAKTYADSCNYVHSPGAIKKLYGENLYGSNPLNTDNVKVATTALRDWISEVQFVNSTNWNCIFTPDENKKCDHYSQIVWKKSTTIGCGMAHCPTGFRNFLVCNYYPTGNVPKQFPY